MIKVLSPGVHSGDRRSSMYFSYVFIDERIKTRHLDRESIRPLIILNTLKKSGGLRGGTITWVCQIVIRMEFFFADSFSH